MELIRAKTEEMSGKAYRCCPDSFLPDKEEILVCFSGKVFALTNLRPDISAVSYIGSGLIVSDMTHQTVYCINYFGDVFYIDCELESFSYLHENKGVIAYSDAGITVFNGEYCIDVLFLDLNRHIMDYDFSSISDGRINAVENSCTKISLEVETLLHEFGKETSPSRKAEIDFTGKVFKL